MPPIDPNSIYTTEEAREVLKISKSTMKRLLKSGIIRANKVGGQYRILGHEILRLVSPKIDKGATKLYQSTKARVKEKIEDW